MSKHVIFSRNVNNTPLTTDRIAQLAPAVFSTSKADKLTDRYVSLHTSDIIPVMADYGYEPVQAAQKRSRTSNPAHAQHMMAFAKPYGSDDGDGIRPEIILYNSHDGTGSVKLFAGAFRFICSNGIIAGEGFSSRMYHNKTLNSFEELLRNTVDTLPALMDKIQALRNTTLTSYQAHDMAIAGVATRWTSYTGQEENGSYAVAQTVKDAMAVNRSEDNLFDAWTVFNRIQESVIRGNAMVRSITAKQPLGVMRKARSLSSIKEHVRINQALWALADETIAA
jgi:hypothetical protein